MYNRYIPQPDGSYSRRRMPDPHPMNSHHQEVNWSPPSPSRPSQPEQTVQPPCPPPPPRSRPSGNCQRRPQINCPPTGRREPPRETGGTVSDFLRQLLPKDFDTGDLLIVILLLLMSGDCKEDQNYALLTLALYLFM